MLAISQAHARRFLVRRHLLDPPRGLPARAASVLAVVSRLGSLQFDPLASPGARSHDLVLHARIRGYRTAWCDRWLYGPPEERRLFETYNKSLNILPIEEMPFYRDAWDRAERRYATSVLAQGSAAVAAIVERIRCDGPLSTAAFKHLDTRIRWGWGVTPEGRATLEALFEAGRVAIARRDGNRRTYDLVERIYPPELLARRVPEAAATRHRLLSRYRGVGLMAARTASELTLRTVSAAERAALVAGLCDDGALVAVSVEGLREPRYVLAEEMPILDAASAPRSGAAGVTLLAPLDPMLWDRRLVKSLFAFDYLWEVYTPEAKRRDGYYVLPILFGDRMVGRIEPRFDRRRGVLEVLGVRLEAGFDLDEPGFVPALGDALDALARFVGAERLSFSRKKGPRALASALSKRTAAPA
jgi:uncharacterized protein